MEDSPASNDSRKRRRDEVASSGGRGDQRGRGRGGRGGGSRGRGDGRPPKGGRGGRGNGGNFPGRGGATGRGRGPGRHGRGHNSTHNSRGGGRHGSNNGNHRQRNKSATSFNSSAVDSLAPAIPSSAAVSTNVVSATSSEASFVRSDSDAMMQDDGKTAAIVPWPDPASHYIPVEEEKRLLPVLVHWGQSERGMMKDQPPFRLQKLQKALGQNGANKKDRKSSVRPPKTQQLSLIQSLSLRRHHLKLLNPKYSMSSLRLGNEDDIRNAAELFEVCVEAYLRRHNVQFWTEADQRRQHEERTQGLPFSQRKQPPTPDFMMKEGHCAKLSFTNGAADGSQSMKASSRTKCQVPINWIEAKMFFGASTIPSGTPNAVGCILPKMKEYVSRYGTGALVFMYGCGVQLAAQLLEAGVVALDGRGLDLERVEEHQRTWCADRSGTILF